jgi:hypothetical protein
MKYLKSLLLTLSVLGAFFVPFAAVTASAQVIQCTVPEATLCKEAGNSGGQTAQSNSLYGPNGIITKVVKILTQVIGFAAVVVIIVGGFKYVTSSGDPNNVTSAKNTILYAVIGLVVAVLGRSIVVFVLNKL